METSAGLEGPSRSTPDRSTAGDDEVRQLNRRTALKVAIGGVAAGTVFVAPRIEGFKVVPDYAAAGTCDATSKSTAGRTSNTVYCVAGCGSVLFNFNCWGADNGGCGCNSFAFAATSVNVGGQTITMNATANGRANNKSNCAGAGSVSVNVAGKNRGSCNVAVFVSGCGTTNNITFNTNGNLNSAMVCAGNSDSDRTATLTLTCSC